MPIKILMPALSPTMTEGNLSRWLKNEGDAIAPGDVLAEIETDKATMEVEATDEGTLGQIVVPAGTEGVKVNQVIGLILEEGEGKDALSGAAAPTAKPAPPQVKREPAKPESAAKPASADKPEPPKAAMPHRGSAREPSREPGEEARTLASPLARRMAEQAGIDLAGLAGSGPHGRIVKIDIEAAIAGGAAPRAPGLPVSTGFPTPDDGAPFTDVPHSQMRKVIGARLAESKRTIPHYYLTTDCRIDALMGARKAMNAGRADGAKLSVNDFIIAASARALRAHPEVNVSWLDNAMRRYNTVDVAIAVALEEGLITPIIRHADMKGLDAISAEMRALAEKARAGKLAPEEYQGGGFTISNLGMFGVREFAAVINPPQASILAVGAGESRAVVTDGALGVATVMSITLSCDHRAIDGATGARFLATLKGFIEQPVSMLL